MRRTTCHQTNLQQMYVAGKQETYCTGAQVWLSFLRNSIFSFLTNNSSRHSDVGLCFSFKTYCNVISVYCPKSAVRTYIEGKRCTIEVQAWSPTQSLWSSRTLTSWLSL